MANPAAPQRQLIGVYDEAYTEIVAHTLARLGRERALVVCAEDGLDELSITTRTKVSELHKGEVRSYVVDPEQLGLERASLSELSGGDPATNTQLLTEIVSGERRDARRAVVTLNAGAAIMLAGLSETIVEGIRRANDVIDSGAAWAALSRLKAFNEGA